MNNNDCTFINVQGFLPSYYSSFESLVYRNNNDQKDLVKQTKQMTEEELKKLFEFYLENIEDYLNSTKSSVESVYQTVYPIGIDNLSDDFEKDIRNKYKEKSLEYAGEDSRIKAFFELINKDDTDKLNFYINSKLQYQISHFPPIALNFKLYNNIFCKVTK